MKRCGIRFEDIAAYADGKAEGNLDALVRDHLASGCEHCHDTLNWLQSAKSTLLESQRVQVPEQLLNRASALFRERFRVPERPSWLAQLQFDSRQSTPSLAGARGDKQEGVQLVYSTEQHDIELFQERNAQGTWYLIGQVLPRQGDTTFIPARVVLEGLDHPPFTLVPETEEFHLISVLAGRYTLRLSLADGEIVLPDVVVGHREAE